MQNQNMEKHSAYATTIDSEEKKIYQYGENIYYLSLLISVLTWVLVIYFVSASIILEIHAALSPEELQQIPEWILRLFEQYKEFYNFVSSKYFNFNTGITPLLIIAPIVLWLTSWGKSSLKAKISRNYIKYRKYNLWETQYRDNLKGFILDTSTGKEKIKLINKQDKQIEIPFTLNQQSTQDLIYELRHQINLPQFSLEQVKQWEKEKTQISLQQQINTISTSSAIPVHTVINSETTSKSYAAQVKMPENSQRITDFLQKNFPEVNLNELKNAPPDQVNKIIQTVAANKLQNFKMPIGCSIFFALLFILPIAISVISIIGALIFTEL